MRSHLRSGGWALIDQGISSATNFLAGIYLARALGPGQFGGFAVAFASWLVVLGAARSFLVQPFVVMASRFTPTDQQWKRSAESAAGVALGIGAVGGGALVAVGAAVGLDSSSGAAIASLAPFCGPLILQDFWRFAAFSSGRAPHAAYSDLIWAAGLGLMLFALQVSNALSAASGIAAWGASGSLAAGVGIVQLGIVPHIGKRAKSWLKEVVPLAGWFSLSNVVQSVGAQSVLLIIRSSAGEAAVGGLRSVQNLIAPAMIAGAAGELAALPVVSRLNAQGRSKRVLEIAVGFSVALLALVAVWGAGIVWGGRDLLTTVFGAHFAPFAPLIVPVVVAALANTAASGALLALRASKAGKRLVLAQLVGSAVQLSIVGVLVWTYGIYEATWGLAAAAASYGGMVWWLYGRSRRYLDAQPMVDEW